MPNQKIHVVEDEILLLGEDVLECLLWDNSRPEYVSNDGTRHHHHIYWATDNYDINGEGFRFFDEIQVGSITGENKDLVRPRSEKSKDEQERRTKEKAEVFTPSWVCNAQINLIDEAWFGRSNVFNEEFCNHTWKPNKEIIYFPEGKSWKDYVWATRMEIACGEGPYIASRYDTTSGEPIGDLDMRIGIIDRKLRVVNENVQTLADWIFWAKCALKSTYGFEWQGDNLLIARKSLLSTIIDYYDEFKRKRFGMYSKHKIKHDTYLLFAKIISWNLFQMDGIKLTLPMSGEKEKEHNDMLQGDFFVLTKTIETTSPLQLKKVYAHIAEWNKFGEHNIKDLEFRQYIKK